MMPPQELIRNLMISRCITTHVKRKSPLHDNKVSNKHFIIVKILSTHVSTEISFGNEK